jgi:outer membrane lipoprotein-sorting protein
MVRPFRLLSPPPITRHSGAWVVRLAVVLLAVSGLGGSHPPVAADLFDDIHTRVRIAEAKRQTIRARFTETTISSLLVKPMVSEGTLLGAKPASLLMTYTSPERKTIVMTGNLLHVIRPDRGEREQVDVTQIMKRVNHYFVNANPEELRKSFTVRAFVDPDSPAGYQIDLVPTRTQIRQGLERLQIWIARDPLLLSQIRITFAGGDTTTVRIENAELNVTLPANAFDVDILPARQQK